MYFVCEFVCKAECVHKCLCVWLSVYCTLGWVCTCLSGGWWASVHVCATYTSPGWVCLHVYIGKCVVVYGVCVYMSGCMSTLNFRLVPATIIDFSNKNNNYSGIPPEGVH